LIPIVRQLFDYTFTTKVAEILNLQQRLIT